MVDLLSDDGLRIVGVAAAGSTSLKMGINNAGVIAASNIARTTELRARNPGLDDLRALDRGRLLRHGLGHRNAVEAARSTVDALLATRMATPGNIEFAEADQMIVIEGSYDHLATERIRDRTVARTNMFVNLDHLNDPEDTSSPARYHRVLQVLEPRTGSVTPADLRSISQDHTNGPGLNSICRHSHNLTDETSLSAMVVATNREDPSRASVDIAQGKPCWSWPGSGVVSFRMDDHPDLIGEHFRSGQAWQQHYRENALYVESPNSRIHPQDEPNNPIRLLHIRANDGSCKIVLRPFNRTVK